MLLIGWSSREMVGHLTKVPEEEALQTFLSPSICEQGDCRALITLEGQFFREDEGQLVDRQNADKSLEAFTAELEDCTWRPTLTPEGRRRTSWPSHSGGHLPQSS